MRADRMLMAEAVSSAQLNDLLIQIGRSLLQYIRESWPWSASDADGVRRTLFRLADEQKQLAADLARLLDDRGETIDYGTYPTEYTSLHYLAVDYVLERIVTNQELIVRESDALAAAAAGDLEVAPRLREIAATNRSHLEELRRLSSGNR